jgi:hypothetical protein
LETTLFWSKWQADILADSLYWSLPAYGGAAEDHEHSEIADYCEHIATCVECDLCDSNEHLKFTRHRFALVVHFSQFDWHLHTDSEYSAMPWACLSVLREKDYSQMSRGDQRQPGNLQTRNDARIRLSVRMISSRISAPVEYAMNRYRSILDTSPTDISSPVKAH